MYFTGIIIAASTFLAIGIWHPIVIKTDDNAKAEAILNAAGVTTLGMEDLQ